MANETIYSDDYTRQNSDGTVTKVERSIRLNGDCSEMVHLFDVDGSHLVVWHTVHNAENKQIHLDEKFRRAGCTATWPPEGYRLGGP